MQDREELEAVLGRCRSGDPLAWEYLVRSFQGRIYGLSLHYVQNREEARDVAQEVFVRVFRRLHDCPSADQFPPWILTITRNACIDWLRRRKARPQSFDSRPEEFGRLAETRDSPEESASRNQLRRRVHRSLQKLTALSREIILLKEIQELSLQEIAVMLKIPLGTVKSRSHRARLELAEALLSLSSETAPEEESVR